jgi:hypothetical protein
MIVLQEKDTTGRERYLPEIMALRHKGMLDRPSAVPLVL